MAKEQYPLRKFMLLLIGASTVVFYAAIKTLPALGIGYQGALSITAFIVPSLLFIGIYGFYKGLIRHYGLNWDDKLFFSGT